MSGSKSSSRSATVKRDSSLRYATRHMAIEKGKRGNQQKDNGTSKTCDCSLKSEAGKNLKHVQNSKLPIKKVANKCCTFKEGKTKATSANHREKVVIVSKRSSSVSVVKSCNLRKSVSVKKVSYSTSVVLSSDEDSDSEEESEEEKEKESLKKTRTVVKCTTSKVKSSFTNTKKNSEKKSAQKAKAIKLLCEKLSSGKHKDALANRELRPRFPYSMLQELPTARTHRMASLNALAKVHVLYENEGRTVGESLNDADETTLIDFLNENSDDSDNEIRKNEPKSAISSCEKKSEKTKFVEEKQKNERKRKTRISESKSIQKKRRKRNAPDVELIDTRVCKRMASLNAQAILAASYLQEPKPKRIPKKVEKCDSSSDTDEKEIIVESKCDIEIIEETDSKDKITQKLKDFQNSEKCNTDKKCPTPKECSLESAKSLPLNKSFPSETPYRTNWSMESDVAVSETHASRTTPLAVANSSVVTSTSATKVGVTQYTEVTKVQINACQDSEIKEESKSESKIERLISNDDVAITQMYHYQSKNSNESYCVQMQTTFKPASKTLTPPIALSSSNPVNQQINESVLQSGQNYYGTSSRNPILPPQPYNINQSPGPIAPIMNMDHRVPRQYGGSAFTVPHYRHPQPSQFTRGEYGYYQPAGPLIQPSPDQCTIHKPVPYHPQPNRHQLPQRPQPPGTHRNAYQSFASQNPHSNNSSAIASHQAPHRQKHIIPACPPPLEILPPQPKHSRYSRCRSGNEIQSRGFNSPSRYGDTTKQQHHSPAIRSYSSPHNFTEYHKQRSDSNSFMKYTQPYEQKDHRLKNNFPSTSGYNVSHQNVDNKPCSSQSHDSIHSSDNRLGHAIPHSTIHQNQSPSSGRNHFKNLTDMVHSKERPWSITDDHCRMPVPQANFQPYQENQPKILPMEMQDATAYPVRPPSVIEIIDETPRDTRTYIQLEVPKNSHREKIVVVDVENDDIEEKHNHSINSDKVMSSLNTPVHKSLPPMEKETIVKIEQPYENRVVDTIDLTPDENKHVNETPDVTILEVKKKKESAVIRRARLHGKQRTFRDCYNRPLAQLSKSKKSESSNICEEHLGKKFQPLVSLPRLVLPKLPEKKPFHGWSWEGTPQEKSVYISNDDPPCIRKCYSSIRHVEGDVISVRDSVFLRSGPRKTDLPFVAKITALWENSTDGEMNMSLLWYYRPEHTETGIKISYSEDEIFASKHRDTNSVACIEDKCYVLTYAEYCRYRKKCRLLEDSTGFSAFVVPEGNEYLRTRQLPPSNISPDLVLYCRKVYDYRQKRLLKNPV